ncbi:MAG: amino acid adenylation domain-containing protein [Cyanobacteria bacterium J06632_22]
MTAQPSIQALRQRISSLSPAQRELFRQQLAAKGIDWSQLVSSEVINASDSAGGAGNLSNDAASSRAASRPELLPLSPAQQQLWVTHQLQADSSAYHIAIALQFSGDLNIAALIQSLQVIVDRHETLRTTFVEQDGQPSQKILSSLPLDIPLVDINQADADEVAAAITQQRQALTQQPFDLATGPLLRACLLRIDGQTAELVLVLHHIIADGWSRGILLKELAENYRSLIQTGSLLVRPPLSHQYADWVLQQRQRTEDATYQSNLQHWVQQLNGLHPLDLPQDRTSRTDFSSHTLTATLSLEQTTSVKQLARRSGVSLFMLLLAVFKLLLHRYSGQRDIAVGIPVAGRDHPTAEPLIGFFINTLVLRTQLQENPSWDAWLQQVKATLADALEHQSVPFAEVVDALGVDRVPGQTPLFNVMFQVQSGYQTQNAAKLGLDFPGLSVSQDWIELDQTKFDMSWHVVERNNQLTIAVEYRTALYDCDRIQRLLGHFQTLLQSVFSAKDDADNKLISDLSILSPQEQRDLTQWQKSAATTFASAFPQRFEQQVTKTPDAVAVRSETETMTYAELNQRANQLAHWLTEQGIRAGSLVGICLPAGVDLMVALIGTLKSGAVYIPLDPSLPQARLQFMVQDAGLRAIIAERELLAILRPDGDGLNPVVCLTIEEQNSVLDSQAVSNLNADISAEQLAYVIYTSGSTGQPKGTLLTHGGFINYLDWCLATYPLTAGQGVPVQGSIGFDATITSLFSPLLAGQTLLFNLGTTEIEAIQTALTLGVSLIKLTPAHLRALEPLLLAQSVETIPAKQLPKALVIGGEALHGHHISFWQKHFPTVALFNEYGPTEATVGCCVYRATVSDDGPIPIGRPINGAQLYVLDEYLAPVPAGVPGELYIGGAGVAQGYLNRPELTAERFVRNPFTLSSDAALYKTGDLACYRPDGTLMYLGRRDSQVKLRGFRIEPGEIEAALSRHERVKQAVVMLKTVGQQQNLVGYVVPADLPSADSEAFNALTEDLAAQLRQSLPTYMVPSRWVPIDRLPLTLNGKVDRTALEKITLPETSPVNTGGGIPQTQKEKILLSIWQQILGQEKIGIHDNFFSLGGDSISAMQIVAKARQQRLQITPAQLFDHQTVADQAAVATVTQVSSATGPVVGDAILGPIQQEFFARSLPNPHHYNQSILLSVEPTIDAEAAAISLRYLVQHHDALRLRFHNSAEGWAQDYASPDAVQVPFEILDLRSDSQSAYSQTVLDLQASLSLSDGPLFRGALLQLDSGWRLLLVAHHLIMDGVSWRILLADWVMLYQQALTQQPLTLLPRTTAFSQWTQHLTEQSFEAEQPVWTEICQPVSLLPVDNAAGSNTEADSVEVSVSLDAKQLEALQSLSASLDAVLLAGVAQTLTQWSRSSTLVVDLEGHGRHVWDSTLDLSRTVGWFTALHPIRLELPLGSPQEQLTAVANQLKKIPNHGIGYGVLKSRFLKSSLPSEQIFTSPAEVNFNYLGSLDLETSSGPIQRLAPESLPAMCDPQNPRQHQIAVVSFIRNSPQGEAQLHTLWRYSQQRYQRGTITALAQRYLSNLLSLAAQPVSPNPVAAPSRFSAKGVDAQQLNQLMRKLKAKGGV